MDACRTIVFGLVTSHLDYANALYIGLPDCDLAKLQHVQSAVAKLVLNKSKSMIVQLKPFRNYTGYPSSSESSTRYLHWYTSHLKEVL